MFKSFVDGIEIVVALLAVITVLLLFTAEPVVRMDGPVDGDGGGQLYAASCAGCHGGDRSGGVGPALTGSGALDRFDDIDQLVRFVELGVPGRMPGFETRLMPGEIAQIAAFVWENREG